MQSAVTTKPYRFMATVEGYDLPLKIEVDCDSDRAATLVALDMACDLTTVEVWDGERRIYRVPSVNEALKAFGIAKMSGATARQHAQH